MYMSGRNSEESGENNRQNAEEKQSVFHLLILSAEERQCLEFEPTKEVGIGTEVGHCLQTTKRTVS